MDIVGVRSVQNRYYLNNGLFSLSKLKLLVDAVECSQFIFFTFIFCKKSY